MNTSAPESLGIKITITDLTDSSSDEVTIPPGDYLLICVEPCYQSYVQVFASGTHQITIKGRIQR